MRKFALLCTALFTLALLAALYVLQPQSGRVADVQRAVDPVSPESASAPSAAARPTLVLRLDTTLSSRATGAPLATARLDQALAALKQPAHRRPLLFIAVAMALGLLTSWLFRRRPEPAMRRNPDFSTSALTQTIDTEGRPVIPLPEVEALTAQHAAEKVALQEELLGLRKASDSARVTLAAQEEQVARQDVEKTALQDELLDLRSVVDGFRETLAVQEERLARQSADKIELQDELLNLRKEMDSFKDRLADREERIARQDAEKTQLQGEIEDLRSAADRFTETITTQQERLAQQDIEKVELQDEILDLRGAVDRFTATMSEYTAENSAMQEENAALRATIESYEAEQQDKQLRLVEHETTIQELRDEMVSADELAGSLHLVRQENALLGEQLKERDDSIANLQVDIENWREQWTSQDQQIVDLSEQITLLNSDVERSRQELEASQELVEELRLARDSLLVEVERLGDGLALAEDRKVQLADLNDRYAATESARQQLEESLEAAEETARAVPGLHKELANTRDELDHATQDNSEALARLRDLQESYDNLIELQSTSDQELFRLRHANEAQSTELDEQLGLLGEARTELEHRHADLNALQRKLDTEQSDKQLQIANLAEQRNFLEQANADLQRTEQLLGNTEAQLAEESAAKNAALENRDELQSELENLRNLLDETEQNNVELTGSVESLREDLVDMANKINQKKTVIANLNQKVEDALESIDVKESEIIFLNERLADEHVRIRLMQNKISAANATEERLDTWDNSLQTFRNEIAGKNRLIDDLHDQLAIANSSSDMLKAQIREMDEQIDTLHGVRDSAQQLEKDYAELSSTIDSQGSHIQGLHADQENHLHRVNHMLEQLQALETERRAWQQQINNTTSAMQELQDELLDSYTIMMRLDELLHDEARAVETEQAYASDAQPTLGDASNIVDKLARQIGTAQADRKALLARTSESQTLQQLLDDQTVRQQQLDMELQALRDQIAHTEESLKNTRHELQTRLEHGEQQSAEIHDLQDKVYVLEQSITDKQRLIDESEAAAEQAALELQAVNEQLFSANAQLHDQQQTMAALEQSIEDKQRHVDASGAAEKLAAQELATERGELARASAQINEHQETIVILEQSIADKTRLIEAADSAEAEARATLDTERELLGDARQELQKSRDEQRALQAETERLQSELEQLQSRYAAERLEHAQRHEAEARSLREDLDHQHAELVARYTTTHAQLKGELAEQKEANSRLMEKIAQQRERLSSLKQVSDPLPVLQNKVTGGQPSGDIPVLGKNRQKTRDDIPVLGRPGRYKDRT